MLKIKITHKPLSKPWSEEEETILLDAFIHNQDYTKLNRGVNEIKRKLSSMNVYNKRMVWSEDENNFMKENYTNLGKDELLKKLDRSWEAIKIQAAKLKIPRSHDFVRESKMSNLLMDSNQAFYWLGFLLADGHFNFKNKRIYFTLKLDDIEHLKNYADFIGTENIEINYEKNFCCVKIQNIDIFTKVTNKLKLFNSKKSINPNKFSKLQYDPKHMLSLIIGFIDGDGCIRNQTNRLDCLLSIHIHSNWLDNLTYMENFIYSYFNFPHNKILTKIRNDGYANLHITNNSLLKKLKKEVVNLNLTVLDRKWDKIKENVASFNEIKELQKIEISELLVHGHSIKEIIGLGYKESMVYKVGKQ